MIEKLKHMQAFEYYYALGLNRSYQKVAEKYNVSVQSVEAWGKNFGWQKRVAARDIEEGNKLREQNNVTIVDEKDNYRKIIKASLATYVDALKEGKVKVTKVSDVIALMELDMRIAGISDENDNTSDETKNTINQLLESVKLISGADEDGVSE